MSETDIRLQAPSPADGLSEQPDETPTPVEERPRRWLPDFYLLALVPIVCALTAIRLDARVASGPSWDTYAFLDNAADMAGRSVGYVEPHRPPMLPFLTSLLLRLGFWSVTTIQILEAGITVLGVIAFYLLLRRRFERPLAMMASVLLILVPPVWAWLGAGYTDSASVALSIWAMLFVVKGTEDDSRWYWIAFPMVLFAILTRFGAFIMIVPVTIWLMLRAKPFQQAKDLLIGMGLTAMAYLPAAAYFDKYFKDPFFPFAFAGRVAEVGLAGAPRVGKPPTGLAVIPGWYFIKNLARLLFQEPFGPVGTVFLALTALGLLAAIVAALARQRPAWRWLLPIGVTALFVLAEFRGGSVLRVFSIALLGFVIGKFMTPGTAVGPTPGERSGWMTFQRLDPSAALALDATVLVWGLLFFDAHGHMQPQIDRYFITMAPVALYFVALGWRTLGIPLTLLGQTLRYGFAARADSSSRLAAVIGIIGLTGVALVSATIVAANYSATERRTRDPIVLGAEKSAAWLLANDKDIRTKTVYSDVWPLTSWYLGFESFPMPTFESGKAFPHELDKNHVDYFVTIRGRRYPGYKGVYGAGSAVVLKYQSTFARTLPAVLYFGDGWDAYAEQLCNFDFNLFFSSRRQIGTGTWMLDAMTPEELAKFDAVAIFGTHWRSKGTAEKTLRRYVENGGVAVIDASHNMDGFSYPLVDTVFMDVLVRRYLLPQSAVMSVAPELAQASRVPTSFEPGPFVGEKGGPWYAAIYAPSTWARTSGQTLERYQVLASLSPTEPVVLVQRIGKGRVYWLSGNLVWHAFLEGNDNDVRLVRGVFRQAVGLPAIPESEVAVGAKPWFISKKTRPVKAPSASTSPTSGGSAAATSAMMPASRQ